MAKKEARTDLWVARQLDDSKIKYDPQGSTVKEINEALQSASKRGTGNTGYPEYVAVVKDFVIVIEDKADLAKHQKLTNTGILSVDPKDIADYAVNGAYFYAKHIAKNSSFHKIFAIGVSGDEKHHKITPMGLTQILVGSIGGSDSDIINISAISLSPGATCSHLEF